MHGHSPFLYSSQNPWAVLQTVTVSTSMALCLPSCRVFQCITVRQAIEALDTTVSYGFSRSSSPIFKIIDYSFLPQSPVVGIELRVCTWRPNVLPLSYNLSPLLKQRLTELPRLCLTLPCSPSRSDHTLSGPSNSDLS